MHMYDTEYPSVMLYLSQAEFSRRQDHSSDETLEYLQCSVPMFCGSALNFIYEELLGDYA